MFSERVCGSDKHLSSGYPFLWCCFSVWLLKWMGVRTELLTGVCFFMGAVCSYGY